MNSIENISRSINYNHKGKNEGNKCQNFAIDLAATITTVGCYYPLRTVGARWMKGLATPFSFRLLYSGFGYGCLAAHQLFLMVYFNRTLNEWNLYRSDTLTSRIAVSAMSGALSTFTTVPFEARALWMQQGDTAKGVPSYSAIPISAYFRGFTPMLFRQMGLSLGMFAFPDLFRSQVQRKIEIISPGSEGECSKCVQITSSIFGGCCAAVATHVPELARMKMQSLNGTSLSTKEAFQGAWKDAFSIGGKKFLMLRLGVVVVATVAMDAMRKFYSYQLT